MSSSDWTPLVNSLGSGSIARGVTAGITPPNGGGVFVYGANSLTATPGAFGLYATPQSPNTNFNPMLKGGSISMAIQRGAGGGLTGFDAFLFLGLQGNDVGDEGYLLGLSDGDPCVIELRKGVLSLGLPDEAPGGASVVLARSTDEIAVGEWCHLYLEMVVNDNNDVVLNAYRSDLGAHAVSAPTFAAIPGIAQFIDDALGVNSGSLPYLNGRAGFGCTVKDAVRRAYFDHVILTKQL